MEGNSAADPIDGINNIGARLAKDDEHDGALAVQIAGDANVLNGIDYVGDIGKMDGGAFVIADDDRLVVFGVGNLIICNDVGRDISVGDLALGKIGILQTKYGLQVRHRQAHAVELRGIYFHADRRQCAAADRDLANTRNLRQLLLHDRGGFVVKLIRSVLVRRQPQNHDRGVGGIDLAIGRIRRKICGQIRARRVDGSFHVSGCSINVTAEIELNGDRRCAQAAGRSHLRNTGDVAELPFQRSGNRRGHDLGAGSGQAGTHGNCGKVHLWQRGNRKHLERNRAGNGDRHRQQRRCNRPMDEWPGDVHNCPEGCGSAAWTCFLLGISENRCARLSKKI